MIRKLLLPALSALGVLFAIFMVITTTKKEPKAVPVEQPPKAPFRSYVSGDGLIESATQNIQIGASEGGVVVKVFVHVGDTVTKEQPLWETDPGPKLSELHRYEAVLASAEATLQKDRMGTRPEELERQQDLVNQAQAQVNDAAQQLKLRESAFGEDAHAVSQDEINQAHNALRQRQAALQYAQHELERLRNGTWAPDIKIQEAAVQEARAQVEQTRLDLDRLTVRSPIDGKVLQVNIYPGEYAPAGQTSDALMLVGNTNMLMVRAQIDEDDAWRVQENQPAVAYPRGQHNVEVPLSFVRFEPYVIPKKSLTGDSTERVDTRVLEVLYSFRPPKGTHLFVGQMMDVYVQAKPLASSSTLVSSAKGAAH